MSKDAKAAELKPLAMTKRGLPIEGAPWTLDHDQVLFRRFRRLFAAVPWRALRRMVPYLLELLNQAERDAGEREDKEAKDMYVGALAGTSGLGRKLQAEQLAQQTQPAHGPYIGGRLG